MIVLKATQDSVVGSSIRCRHRRATTPILANVLCKTGSPADDQRPGIQIRTNAELDGDSGGFTTTVGARKLIDIPFHAQRPDRFPG
jgi:DNA polymerase-3 subunit beta